MAADLFITVVVVFWVLVLIVAGLVVFHDR